MFSTPKLYQPIKAVTEPNSSPNASRRLLLYEPRGEGHHPVWLRMMVEDFLGAGYALTLAVPSGGEWRRNIDVALAELSGRVQICNAAARSSAAGHLAQAAVLLEETGADSTFFCCFDEIASACLRRAAFGLMPPRQLHGRIVGVYMRPRFLTPGKLGLNERIKRAGFNRLAHGGWFRRLFYLDEALLPGTQSSDLWRWLPEPSPSGFVCSRAEARAHLNLPADKRVFLFYGGPYRRKGLHLAVAALLQLPPHHASFLLCAGQQPEDKSVVEGLAQLVAQGRALLLNRYINAAEGEYVFSACDAVLLPYLNHFGSSSVQAQAAAAGKPVVASDENLVGRRTREFAMGWPFPTGDATALRQAIETASAATPSEWQSRIQGASAYATRFSRSEFRRVLVESLASPLPGAR